jgi:hypothetical protein
MGRFHHKRPNWLRTKPKWYIGLGLWFTYMCKNDYSKRREYQWNINLLEHPCCTCTVNLCLGKCCWLSSRTRWSKDRIFCRTAFPARGIAFEGSPHHMQRCNKLERSAKCKGIIRFLLVVEKVEGRKRTGPPLFSTQRARACAFGLGFLWALAC